MTWRGIAKGLVAVSLFIWLIGSGRIDFHIFFSSVHPLTHLLALLFLLLGLLLQCCRWWVLLGGQGIRVPLSRACRLTWISQFFFLVLPGVLGAELIRGYYIVRETRVKKMAGASTVLLDRALGMYAQLLLGTLSFLYGLLRTRQAFADRMVLAGILVVALFVSLHFVFPVLRSRGLARVAERLLPHRLFSLLQGAAAEFRNDPRSIRSGILLSIASAVLTIFAFYLGAAAVLPGIAWEHVFLACPLVFVATALPLAPGGLGVGEAAAALLFSGFSLDAGASLMLLFRFWNMLLRLPGGMLFLWDRAPVMHREPDPSSQ
jgi:hypothetical protein